MRADEVVLKRRSDGDGDGEYGHPGAWGPNSSWQRTEVVDTRAASCPAPARAHA